MAICGADHITWARRVSASAIERAPGAIDSLRLDLSADLPPDAGDVDRAGISP
jgi:hypothetical protein